MQYRPAPDWVLRSARRQAGIRQSGGSAAASSSRPRSGRDCCTVWQKPGESLMRTMAVLVVLLCPVAAYSQIAGTANLGGPQAVVSTPIPDSDFPAIASKLGLVESPRPAREMIAGWRKPRKVLVAVDNNTNRL